MPTKESKEPKHIDLSFDKYIDNPAGKGSAVISNRQMFKDMYRNKFNALLVKEQGTIKFTVYEAKDKTDSWYIHMKIPSEVVPDFYYDVVVQLYTTDPLKKANANLRNYGARYYSNDPAFVYGFVHAFSQKDMFISDLEPKMSKQALKKVASIKNPNDNIWYVKSLYFAYLTMEKYALFNRITLSQHAKKYTAKNLLSQVMKADDKIKLRQNAAAEIEKKKALGKKKEAAPKLPSIPNNSTKRSALTKTTKVGKAGTISRKTKTTRKV